MFPKSADIISAIIGIPAIVHSLSFTNAIRKNNNEMAGRDRPIRTKRADQFYAPASPSDNQCYYDMYQLCNRTISSIGDFLPGFCSISAIATGWL